MPPQKSSFETLLHEKSRCLDSIPPSSANMVPLPLPGRLAIPLLKKLFFELENLAKDNKNQSVIAFCLLLTTQRMLKEVIVGFLIVGHTQENIDAHFSYLSNY